MSRNELISSDDLTVSIVESGVVTWQDLLRVVQQFKYGRNENRSDLSLVWSERKGTCSSKHAFLKMIADLNQIQHIDLVLGMYKMNGKNTPGVKDVLQAYELDYIIEAHCYLRTKSETLDLTSLESNFNRIKNDILHEQLITPSQVAEFKIDFHKEFISKWVVENTKYTSAEIWQIREECIRALER